MIDYNTVQINIAKKLLAMYGEADKNISQGEGVRNYLKFRVLLLIYPYSSSSSHCLISYPILK